MSRSRIVKIVTGLATALLLVFLFYPRVGHPPINDDAMAEVHANVIVEGLKLYHTKNGNYPDNLVELAPVFLEKIPKDPWGFDYKYLTHKDSVIVYTISKNTKKKIEKVIE